jgi:hypothetical protein
MVITEDQGLLMLRRANPVPEAEIETDVSDVRLHQAIEQRSSEVTQLSTQKQETPKRNRSSMAWLAAAAVVVLVGAAIIFFNQGAEESPPATEVVPTTVAPPTTTAPPSTTVPESALADMPVWLRSGNGQWVPAQSAIPFAFTNTDDWNSLGTALNEERFTICPSTEDGAFSLCNLASVAVLFLEPETIEETRDLLASFEGAELGEEQPITIDGAPGIRFEFTHDVASVSEQVQGEIPVPAAYVSDLGGSPGSRLTPLGEGPLGRSIIFIVDVDGVVVTLSYQGVDTARGAAQDGFDTYQESGLAIVDSIIWGTS